MIFQLPCHWIHKSPFYCVPTYRKIFTFTFSVSRKNPHLLCAYLQSLKSKLACQNVPWILAYEYPIVAVYSMTKMNPVLCTLWPSLTIPLALHFIVECLTAEIFMCSVAACIEVRGVFSLFLIQSWYVLYS